MSQVTVENIERAERSRPILPKEYGMPTDSEGLLDWEWVTERLEKAKDYWVCTVRPDGRPHAVPVWAFWVDGVLYFDGHPQTRWGRNLASNPAISVHIEIDGGVVILEGIVQDIAHLDRPIAEKLYEVSMAKYNYSEKADVYVERGIFSLKPKLVLAWGSYPKTLTRWRLPE